MENQEINDGNKMIVKFMGIGKPIYQDTGRRDDNGMPILDGSVIIADGYGADDNTFYCVFQECGEFFSCAYGDRDPISEYKSIVVKGHCEDYRHLYEKEDWDWSGNLGEALHDVPTPKYHSSWDWLIPVVEQIEKGNYGFKMCRKVVEVYIDDTKEVIIKVKEQSRIESLYKAVIQFIQWYTQTSNPKN